MKKIIPFILLLFTLPACESVPDSETPKEQIKGKYMFRRGDSIHAIAMERYGHGGYAKMLQRVNGKDRFKAGDPVALPSIAELCKNMAPKSTEPEAIAKLSRIYYLYREVEPVILAIKYPDIRDPQPVSMTQDQLNTLLKVSELANQVAASLEKSESQTPGLKKTAEEIGKLATYLGMFAKRKIIIESFKPDFIHLYFSEAIYNAIP